MDRPTSLREAFARAEQKRDERRRRTDPEREAAASARYAALDEMLTTNPAVAATVPGAADRARTLANRARRAEAAEQEGQRQ